MDSGSASLLPQRRGSQQTAATSTATTLDLLRGARNENDVTIINASGTATAMGAASKPDAGAGAGSLTGGKPPCGDGGRALHSIPTAAPRLEQWHRQQRRRRQPQQQQPSHHLPRLDNTAAVACRGESLLNVPPSRATDGHKPKRILSAEARPDKKKIRSLGNRGRPSLPMPPAPGPGSARRSSGDSESTDDGSDRNSTNVLSAAGMQAPIDFQSERGCGELDDRVKATAVDVHALAAPEKPGGGGGGGGYGGGGGGGGGSGGGGGGGDGGRGNSSGGQALRVPLTEERVAAVQCYLRDNDPIFVRKNLKRLLEGTLKQLAVGETVTVARRCREGENNEGGIGRVSRVLSNFFYDIKYAVGGVERGVDACFVGTTTLLQTSRRPRDGTPRCPDCRSFLHECTCEGTVGAAAALAATEAPASNRSNQHAARRASPPPFENPRSLKRPRSTLSEETGVRLKEPPSRRGDGGGSATWSKSEWVPDNVAAIGDSRRRERGGGGGR